MSERDHKILEAAFVVFSRYGIGKTTMMDIAREAGVARQTLYNAYPNKEEILRATVRSGIAKTATAVREAWAKDQSFDDKLQSFFELAPLAWYDATQAAPDAAELVEGLHRVASEELKVAAQEWESTFANLLKRHFDLSVRERKEIGEFIYASAINAKAGAENRKNVEQRLRVLKEATLALLATKDAASS